MNKTIMALLVATLPALAFAAPPLGEKPKTVVLDKDEGGRVGGGAWSSDEIKGKVFVLFYVDPDFSDLNNAASEALKAEKFGKDVYQSVAVINMAATWLPNFAIDGKLKDKQKLYVDTIYVRDLHKTLVKEWKVADDNSDVMAFDKEGKLIFIHEGKLEAEHIKAMIEVIKKNM
jgi:predicted transcriptional regulator